MRILCITHADFESPGVIESWTQQKGYDFKISRPYQGDILPEPNHFDMLIIMGGPQSPLALEKYPYLKDEIILIQETLKHPKKILGFCLGAQLIGEALGAQTMRSPEKEVGVYPLVLTMHGKSDPLLQHLPHTFPVIHWHNDMPGLTKDATILAYSEGCPRQIIRYLPHVYGFQCHLEITSDGIETMVNAVPEDLAPSKFTQSAQTLLEQDYTHINHMMTVLLDRYLQL